MNGGDRWPDDVDWWKVPSLAYVKGLQDGAAMERQRIADEDDQIHRAAVQAALNTIEQVDRRRAYDRGEPP